MKDKKTMKDQTEMLEGICILLTKLSEAIIELGENQEKIMSVLLKEEK